MKNFILPIGLAALLLAACGKKDDADRPATQTTPPPSATQPAPSSPDTMPPPATTPPPATSPEQTPPPATSDQPQR